MANVKFTLSDSSTETVTWKLHYSAGDYWGFDPGFYIPAAQGTVRVNPRHYLLKTNIGKTYDTYGSGSTEKIDEIMGW